LFNHYFHLLYVQIFTYNIPRTHPLLLPHWFYQLKGTHVFGDLFPNTQQATKVARETTIFFFPSLTKKEQKQLLPIHGF